MIDDEERGEALEDHDHMAHVHIFWDSLQLCLGVQRGLDYK